MCGIAGFAAHAGRRSFDRERVLGDLVRCLQHRGPDDQGVFGSANGDAGLVATRLAILDLTPAGHQPMRSADGRWTIALNGEIYNFRTIRAELEADGVRFRSDGDTEVVLELYSREGAHCLERLRGMFAFAIWDEGETTCFLARDPLGIKPLYYYHDGASGTLAFSSELRPLLSSGLVPRRLNARGLYGYYRTGSVPEPETLIENVKVLPAGSWLHWRAGQLETRSYWQPRFPESAITTADRAGPPPDYAGAVRAGLIDSIEQHFVSDVPVGIFLSGGLDSTTLVALARATGKSQLRTFSVGSDDTTLDESAVARQTARHFGTDHVETLLDARTSRVLFDEFLLRLDQPTTDGFNTFVVSKLAHERGAKVVLSGLGADELFGGYPIFTALPQLLSLSRKLGILGPTRALTGELLTTKAPQSRWRRFGEFLCKPPTLLRAYQAYRGIYTDAEARALTALCAPSAEIPEDFMTDSDIAGTDSADLRDVISALELGLYMRNQLLRDSDVMSMANGLELRVPFVDRCLFETVATIPSSVRLQAGKRLLADAVPELPAWVLNRPKRGFTFPFDQWLPADWTQSVEAVTKAAGVQATSWYQRWSVFVFQDWWRRMGAGE